MRVSERTPPIKRGGTNKHGNIVFVENRVYEALFTRDVDDSRKLMSRYKLDESQWTKFNTIRHNYDYRRV